MVQTAAHPEAHIIFGAAIDENLEDEVKITVIATGFDDKPAMPKEPKAAPSQEAAPQAQTGQPAAEQGQAPQEGQETQTEEEGRAATTKEEKDRAFEEILSIFNKQHRNF